MMRYQFAFYKDADYEDLIRLVLRSYHREYPTVGVSRVESAKGLHPAFTGNKNAWNGVL